MPIQESTEIGETFPNDRQTRAYSMSDSSPDYDLSYLKKQYVFKIVFLECQIVLTSYGETYHALDNSNDIAVITICANFEWNGKRNDRCGLLDLLGEAFENAIIDERFELRLVFSGGGVLTVPKYDTGFESYLIESHLLPGRFVAIV